MAYPVTNTFVHFPPDPDSSSDEGACMHALRRSKSSPPETTLCPVADTAAGERAQYGEAKKTSHSRRTSLDIRSTRDTLEPFTFDTLPTLDTIDLLPSVCVDLCERHRDEAVDAEETFMAYDERQVHDCEMPQRRPCSDERMSERASTKESNMMAFHVTELHTEAARSQQKPQGITLPHDAIVGDPYRGPESRRPEMRAQMPTKRTTSTRCTMLSTLDLRGENDDLIVGGYVENPQFAVISEPVTTLMVCNLPCALSAEGLKTVVDELGFAGSYNLIHVPKGFRSFLGYGFLSFKEPHVVASFMVAISNYTFLGNSKKRAYCRVADSQNFKANLKRIQRGANRKRTQVLVFS